MFSVLFSQVPPGAVESQGLFDNRQDVRLR